MWCYEARILPAVSYRNLFVEVDLNRRRSVYVEKMRAGEEVTLLPNERAHFERLVIAKGGDGTTEQSPQKSNTIRGYEFIESGLQEYFQPFLHPAGNLGRRPRVPQ